MAIASIGARGSGVSGASGTTVTQTPGTIVAVGRQLLVFVGYSNATDLACTVTDDVSASNVYEEIGSFGSGSARLRVYRCDVKVQVSAASVITATFPSAIVDKTIAAWEYSVAAGSYLAEATAETTVAVNPAANGFGSVAHSGLSSLSRLYLRCGVKIVSSIATITASTNFTSWALAIRSRNNAAAVVPRAEFRINTSTGETSNPTFAVSGVAASVFLAFVEASLPVAGTLTANLGAPTLTAAGAALVEADVSATVPTPTLSAAAASLVEADVSATLDAPTLAADASIQNPGVAGTLSATVPTPTLSATGTAPVSASASPTLGVPTLSAAGAALVEADVSTSVPTPTLSAAGQALVEGDVVAMIGVPTLIAEADVLVGADLSAIVPMLTLDAAGGTPAANASLNGAITAPTLTSEADIIVTGDAAAVMVAPFLAADGSAPVDGDVSSVIDAPTLTATGDAPVGGDTSVAIAAPTLDASGGAAAVGADLVVEIGAPTLSATGESGDGTPPPVDDDLSAIDTTPKATAQETTPQSRAEDTTPRSFAKGDPMFTIKKNDRQPSYTSTLFSNGRPINFTTEGVTNVQFVMTLRGAVTPKVSAVAAIVDSASGKVRHDWGATDTDAVGNYDARWVLTYPGGKLRTVPAGVDPLRITVT